MAINTTAEKKIMNLFITMSLFTMAYILAVSSMGTHLPEYLNETVKKKSSYSFTLKKPGKQVNILVKSIVALNQDQAIAVLIEHEGTQIGSFPLDRSFLVQPKPIVPMFFIQTGEYTITLDPVIAEDRILLQVYAKPWQQW